MALMTKDQTNRAVIFTCDVISVALAYWAAFMLRLDFQWSPLWQSVFWQTLPVVIVLQVSFFYAFRLYRSVWRYASYTDVMSVAKAIVLSQTVIGVIIYFTHRHAFPRSVLIIQPLVAIALVCATRLVIRLSRERRWPLSGESQPRALVVGSADLAENTVRLLGQSGGYHVVGMITEESWLWKKRIHGVPVLGGKKTIPSLLARLKVTDVIVTAAPEGRGALLGELITLCSGEGVRPVSFKLVPSLQEVLGGSLPAQPVRRVRPMDLLDRDAVVMNKDLMASHFRDACVLVTGAAGSIGSELCRQLGQYHAKLVLAVDNSANALFYLERKLIKAGVPHIAILADIRDSSYIQEIFYKYHPQTVFHAAAHKHVAQLEGNVKEGIKNNVLSTLALAKAAEAYGAKKFVLISTDKAVRPSSIMGTTKRLAERLMQAMARESRCTFMSVRFGNVLGSSGSVVRLFDDQIAKGGPVTLTHPDVTRFFMTMEEAGQLILQAGMRGTAGQTFILRMGKPVRIADLARKMILLQGLEPQKDIAIEISGLQPGEKLHEQLWEDEQEATLTHFPNMMVAAPEPIDSERFHKELNELQQLVYSGEEYRVVQKLREMVPTYQPVYENSRERILHDTSYSGR